MAKRARRPRSAVFKAKMALAALAGDKTLAELASGLKFTPTRLGLRSGNARSSV